MAKLALTAFVASVLASPARVDSEVDAANLPESKRTSLGLYVTSQEAFELWKAEPDRVKILDVRTPEEFRQVGYPTMATRIPLTAGRAFVGQIEAVADRDDVVLVICRSGNRSAVAVEILARAGYKNVYTLVDGFEGARNNDPSSPDFGKRTVEGWKNAGLPWTKP